MLVKIDLEGVLAAAEALPETSPSLEGIAPGMQEHYVERDGQFHLDTEWRAGLVDHMKDVLERDQLRSEARNSEELQKRQRIVSEVKAELAKQGVKPELLRAATADFMAQHQFAFRGERVVVIGRLGEADAELAAVSWATECGEPYMERRAKPDSTFTAAVAKMRLH